MTFMFDVEQKLIKAGVDFAYTDLLRYIQNNYSAYCPKCNSGLDYANVSADDYLGACLECDEDFYPVECRLEEDV
jgi:hypothetical protein